MNTPEILFYNFLLAVGDQKQVSLDIYFSLIISSSKIKRPLFCLEI